MNKAWVTVRREYFYRFTPAKLKEREEKMGGEPVRYDTFITGNAAGRCPIALFVINVHCDMELGYQLKIDCRTEDESNSRCSWPVVKPQVRLINCEVASGLHHPPRAGENGGILRRILSLRTR